MMDEVSVYDYVGYSETDGVISCVDCNKDVWCSYPESGDTAECSCGCSMVFVTADD